MKRKDKAVDDSSRFAKAITGKKKQTPSSKELLASSLSKISNKSFTLPKNLLGCFAVVKLWPDVQAAEDECIARLKITAKALGLTCIEVHADGRLIDDPSKIISKKDVDFFLHLHYDTPKLYDGFSFVALWNPTQFYHEWGYPRCTRNLLTHDDFLSCSSPAADDHVIRLIRNTTSHLPPNFNFYHSVADVMYSPSLGDCKLFYAGINWEALAGQQKSRHGALLKRLDTTGQLRIYGPELFQNVKVWDGYNSYIKEIPFDGVSMMEEINKAGIALVLSSQAHKDCELMSNRLFESIASGALVICDENNFAKKFFGDSLLYIDTRLPINEVYDDILEHLDWAKSNKDKAIKMIEKAQKIFKLKFTSIKNLSDLYLNFSERKNQLLEHLQTKNPSKINVRLNLLLPEYSYKILNTHIYSVLSQEYPDFSATLYIDKTFSEKHRETVKASLEKSSIKIDLIEIDFFEHDTTALQAIRTRRPLGKIFAEILAHASLYDAIMFVAPNEQIFSNHLQVLASSLARNPDTHCAATAVILKREDQPINSIHELVDFTWHDTSLPNGFARFIFRVSALSKDLNLALPYLDRKALPLLVEKNIIHHELPATVIIDVDNIFPTHLLKEEQENTIIHDMFPQIFKKYLGYQMTPLPTVPVVPEQEQEKKSEIAPPSSVTVKNHRSTLILFIKLSFVWVFAQIRALTKDGFRKRLSTMKQILEKKLSDLKQVL